MKTIKPRIGVLSVLFILTLAACSGTATSTGVGSDTGNDTIGGTETGTTDAQAVDTSTAADRIESAASALVLSTSAASNPSASAPSFVIDGTSDEWDAYSEETNSVYLEDIFGSASEEPRVVTKVRVLLEQLQGDLEGLFAQDPELDCTGAATFSGGDAIEVAFYGSLGNGTSADRSYDCVIQDAESAVLYGKDGDETIRVVQMRNQASENSEDVDTRGDMVSLRSVVMSAYAERTEDSATAAYLDLQFAHASVYNGPDGEFGTDDDFVFKSRSRITGRATLNSAGEATGSAGEFTVTKYDSSATPEGEVNTVVTKTVGRGNYLDDGYSLFNIDSDVNAFADIEGTFCLQTASDGGLPAYADAANCSALETGYAWGTAEFPFTLAPSIDSTFEDNAFFEGNDTDLVSDTGDNFTIPTY